MHNFSRGLDNCGMLMPVAARRGGAGRGRAGRGEARLGEARWGGPIGAGAVSAAKSRRIDKKAPPTIPLALKSNFVNIVYCM